MTKEENYIKEKCDKCLNDTICNERGYVTSCNGFCSKERNSVQDKIRDIYDAMKDLQIDKNQKYGNAALEPLHIFYKGDSQNSILIRLDDKLNRIKNNSGEIRNNDICDMIGYLVLLLIDNGCTPSDINALKD